MKNIVVCGAGGFIGHHLVKRLKGEGHYVRAIDIKQPEFEPSAADEFLTTDLRFISQRDAFFAGIDEVYQLAADMGGMGFIGLPENDATILYNSTTININVMENVRQHKIPRVFFTSSACVYNSLPVKWYGEHHTSFVVPNQACREESAYPANPDSAYGWEKLYAERMYRAYARCHGFEARVGRLHNIFGPLGTWRGGREKAPAAICRKVAEADQDGAIEIWGDGEATRSFLYIDECIEGIRRLMDSNVREPINIGSNEMVTINTLATMTMEIAGKWLGVRHVAGPEGVRGRNSDNDLIFRKLGWKPSASLYDGLKKTYAWVSTQVDKARNKE